jgi:hypothetical protein
MFGYREISGLKRATITWANRISAIGCTKIRVRCLLALLFACGSSAAYATPEICVSDDLGFAVAATEAEFAPLKIKLVQGTYHVAGTAFDNGLASFPELSLLGGYSAGCASRQIDPDNTVLNVASNSWLVLDMIGDLTVEGIRFTGASAGLFASWSDFDHDIPASVHLAVRRNIFSGGGSNSGVSIDWYVNGSQTFNARLVDNLIHDLVTAVACTVDLGAVEGSDATFTVANNTIVDNPMTEAALCAGYYGANEGVLAAYNNILYGNAGYDLASHTTMLVYDNVIGSHFAYPGGTVELGTLSANPQLDGNFRPIESPPSEAINSGFNGVPGGLPAHDLGGNPRLVGTTVDRGAYESSINNAFLLHVTNASDSGGGSLRAAIASANANGSGLITFDMGAGCGPHVIMLNSALPALTAGAIINGYSQTGSSANDLDVGDDATLCVILEAANGNVTTGLQVAASAGDSAAVSIKGIGFSGFSDAAIDLQGGSGHFIAGNHFGGNVGGHSLQPNGIDIRLGTAAHDAMIGSDDVADRNVIGDATGSGIVLQGGGSPPLVLGTYNNQILNNYIGVGWSPSNSNYTNRGNGTRGVHLLGHDNTLSGNLIGDNVQAGILVSGYGAANNLIDGNFIGLSEGGGTVLGNGNSGIHFFGSVGDAPSGNTVRYNTIAENADEGIWVEIGQHNKIRRNSIFANGLLGIDLAGEGVNANDDDGGIQQNDYANRGQNFPVLTRAAGGYDTGVVSGTLSTTGGDFTVDVYASGVCDGSGDGEGEIWLKSATVTVTVPVGLDEGTASFAIGISSSDPAVLRGGNAITATATDSSGNTSEFSACVAYVNDTIFADGFEPPPG